MPPETGMDIRVRALERDVQEIKKYKVSRRELKVVEDDIEELKHAVAETMTKAEAKKLEVAVRSLSSEFSDLRNTITKAAITFAGSSILFAVTTLVGVVTVVPR